MKKAFKLLGFLLLGVVALVACTLLFFQIKGIPTFDYNPPAEIAALRIAPDSARVARGAKIAQMHCLQCHGDADGKLTGARLFDLPPMFGEIYSLNITRDTVHGIGAWTDGELYYFLRTGRRSDGTWSPIMPNFNLLADEDVYALVAWLRSNDPRLAPDAREYPPNHYNLLVKTLSNTLFSPSPLAPQPIRIPDTTDQVAFGRYVADGLANCYFCHSGDILKLDDQIPEHSAGFYGGGAELRTPEGKPILTPNLTMDPETGIGNLSEQAFIEAVRFGKKPGGGSLSRPMTPYTVLTDAEVRAIHAYLKTVPVIKNQVQRYQAAVE